MARLLACLMWMLVLAAAPPASSSKGEQDAYWAGFAFTGDASLRAEAVPHTNAALGANGVNQLNARLMDVLQQQAPAHISLVSGAELAQLDGSTSATVLAAAIDRELVSVESIGGRYKVLVELALQALFFDFRERQVIATYPITLQHIDLVAQRPSPTQVRAVVYDLIHGNGAAHLPQALADALSDAHPAKRGDAAAAGRGRDANGHGTAETAHDSERALAACHARARTQQDHRREHRHRPTAARKRRSHGQDNGGALLRWTRLPAVDPEPNYIVELQVDDWRRGVISETAAMRQELFGALFSIRFTEPHSGTVYFDLPLRKGATKVIPVTQTDVDVWSASYNTLLTGLDAFAGAASAQPGAEVPAHLPVHGALAGQRAELPGQRVPPCRRQQHLFRSHAGG